jgi:hypothetical protein
MRKLVLISCLTLFLGGAATSQNQKQHAPAPPAKQKSGFVDRVLKFLGISDSPGTLKGPGDEVVSGELWVAELDSNLVHALASGGGYRSPVFMPATNDVLALRGTDLIRFPSGSGEGKKLYSISDVTKLVAFDIDDPDSLLLLRSAGASVRPQVASLSIATGKVTPVDYDPASRADLQMLENLESWTRTYGDKQVYVKRQTKQELSGIVEWSDVFLRTAGREPMDVSNCNGTNCGQPSLSADGRLIVFVKAEPE